MNEQQRQAVERLTYASTAFEVYSAGSIVSGVAVRAKDLRTLLALIDRSTTCFECSTELQGPFCPKCNPAPLVDVAEAKALATDLRAVFRDTENHGGDHQDGDCFICNSPLRAADFLDRLSAPVRS